MPYIPLDLLNKFLFQLSVLFAAAAIPHSRAVHFPLISDLGAYFVGNKEKLEGVPRGTAEKRACREAQPNTRLAC